MNTGQAAQRLGRAPKKLTLKGIPVDPNLRILGVATLVNTFGNGALVTTFAPYFTRVVGLQPTQVAESSRTHRSEDDIRADRRHA
jgi:hypothetical protein